MNRYLEQNLFISTYWEKHTGKHSPDRQHSIKRTKNKTRKRKSVSREESGCVVGAQEQNRPRSFLTTLRAHCSSVSRSESCQRQLWETSWVIYPVLAAVSNLLKWFASPDPRPSCRGEAVFIHHKAPCQGCEWQSSPGGPGGAGKAEFACWARGWDQHLNSQGSPSSWWVVITCSEPVTHCPQPKAQQLLSAPLGTPFKSSPGFLNARFVLCCSWHLTGSHLKCCTRGLFVLFFFSGLAQGTVIPALPWAQTLRRVGSRGCPLPVQPQGKVPQHLQPCKSFPRAPSPCPQQPNKLGVIAVLGEHPKAEEDTPGLDLINCCLQQNAISPFNNKCY